MLKAFPRDHSRPTSSADYSICKGSPSRSSIGGSVSAACSDTFAIGSRVAPASKFVGNTEGDKVCVNIFRHHGSSSNHRTVSYVNSVQDLAAGTDPYVLANGNPLLRQALRIHRSIDSGQVVICRNDDRLILASNERLPLIMLSSFVKCLLLLY